MQRGTSRRGEAISANVFGAWTWTMHPTLPEIVELKLCEQDRIILRPDVLYRFSVDENCAECRRLQDEGSLIRGVSPTE